MNYRDTDKTQREKPWQELDKNATSYIEKILEAILEEIIAVRPLTSHLKNHPRRTRHARHCWRSKDELIRDVLLGTPPHGRASVGRPARTYQQQFCSDTGCSLEDLPRVMDDRDRWKERERERERERQGNACCQRDLMMMIIKYINVECIWYVKMTLSCHSFRSV